MPKKLENSMTSKRGNAVMPIAVIAALAVVFIVFNACMNGQFLTASNIPILLMHSVIPCFIAWGYAFIFATGFVDFSVGAAIILACQVAGEWGNAIGYPGLILGGLVVGVGLMVANFVIYSVAKIPSWVAGLGMTMVYESIMACYSTSKTAQGDQVVALNGDIKALGQMPMIFVVMAIGFVIIYILYNRTNTGLNVRAAGTNEQIARIMGINTKKTFIYAGLFSGIFFGIAAFLNISYSGRIIAATGMTSIGTLFQPLSALLLAQVMQKRINLIIAIPIATVIIAALFNMLTIAGVPSGTLQQTIMGATVVVFGIIAQRGERGVVK